MNKILKCLLIFFIIWIANSSCTMTSLLMLSGDSKEAIRRRKLFTNSLLNSCSPEKCGYDSLSQQFGWCITGEDVTKINNRVRTARENILDYLKNDPWAKRTEIYDRIILEDLYYCRNEYGGRLSVGQLTMYCETKLSTNLENKFSRNNIKYLGQYLDLFKYEIELK